MKDARNAIRREITLPCQAVREHDFKLIADRTLDISIDGLLLPMNRRVLTGESLIVSFSIPGMWIDTTATVARIVHGRRPGDDGVAMGVLFDDLAPSARAALAGFLHGRRIPLPRRGPLSCLRRGGELPRLADEKAMEDFGERDVVDVTDEALELEEVDRGWEVGVLRAVVGAWQNLFAEMSK
jgi:hypothetical protein